MKNIDEDISLKKFKRVYLIIGDENYLINQYENKLKNAVVPEEYKMMNSITFDGINDTEDVASAVETLPFFSDYRLVVIKDSGLLKQGKKDMTDKMVNIVKNIPETAVIIFSDEEVDKRNSLYKAIKKYGYVCEINKLKDAELIRWLGKQSKGKMSSSLAAYFVQTIGDQMDTLNGELDKLLAYCGDNAITKESIDTVCTKSLESNIFDMMDALGYKKADKALDIYNNMLVMKQSPVAVLTMLARQFKLILQCKYLLKKGYSKREIASELSQREFIVDKYIKQGRNFSIQTLMQANADCAELDVRFKQGLITDVLGVEMLILKYSR